MILERSTITAKCNVWPTGLLTNFGGKHILPCQVLSNSTDHVWIMSLI